MSKSLTDASLDSLKAGDLIINRIKTGLITKSSLPNKSEEYPLIKASENFTANLASEDFKKLINFLYL